MKYKGSRSDFAKERDAELLRAYKNLILVRDNVRLTEIAKTIAMSPCSRFWVSIERAEIVICNMDKGKPLENMIPSRKEMFQEIYRRYLILKKEKPSLTKREIIGEIINGQAPSFYLTPQSVITILHRVRKEDKQVCLEKRRRILRYIHSMR